MTITLIVLTYLFGFLGAIFTLLLGVTFTKGQRKKYPILTKLDEKQLRFFFVACVFLALSYGATGLKEILSHKDRFTSVTGPSGALTQKATPTGIKNELEEAANQLASKAEDYFNAAEHDFVASRYRDAACNYRKSFNVVPTMSGSLNLGISLFCVSDSDGALDAFISGLGIALLLSVLK